MEAVYKELEVALTINAPRFVYHRLGEVLRVAVLSCETCPRIFCDFKIELVKE